MWITEQHLKNQEDFDGGVMSMDVEDVKASYYNVMGMAGKLVISKESQPFQQNLYNRLVSRLLEDSWKQNPGKIMFGNSLTRCLIISLPYQRNKNGDYTVERIHWLLQVLRDLLVCMGVGSQERCCWNQGFLQASIWRKCGT